MKPLDISGGDPGVDGGVHRGPAESPGGQVGQL